MSGCGCLTAKLHENNHWGNVEILGPLTRKWPSMGPQWRSQEAQRATVGGVQRAQRAPIEEVRGALGPSSEVG
jgi:hypothetical protein